jgi:hypothetical protein
MYENNIMKSIKVVMWIFLTTWGLNSGHCTC